MKITKLTIIFILAFAISVSAQENPYPNELEGFEFFGKGNLKGLKLGVSTKEDVKEIFGTKIEEFCSTELYYYNSYWLVRFIYFDEEWSKIMTSFNGTSKTYVPANKYLGKLRAIRLWPKPPTSYNQLVFSDEFDTWSLNERTYHTPEKFVVERNDFYRDSYGLKYKVFNEVIYNNLEMKPLSFKGDLVLIEYEIPNEKEKIFVEK